MILPTGKPTLLMARCDEDGNLEPWFEIDTPKEGTLSLDVSEGDKKDFTEEGGGLIDSYQKSAKYTIGFELWAKKDREKPIPDRNGVITDNYAFRYIPEDKTCRGFTLWRTSVSCTETFSVDESMTWKYSINALVSPDHEELMDDYFASRSVELDKNYLAFKSTGDEDGQTFNAIVGAGKTISVDKKDCDWVTTSVDGTEVTVSVSANTTGEKRVAWLVVKEGDRKTEFKVIQAA